MKLLTILFMLCFIIIACDAMGQSKTLTVKKTTMQTFTSVNNYGINDDGIKRTGEPVPGAEIYVELESDKNQISKVISARNGEFEFEIATLTTFPKQGTFIITVVPSKAYAKSKKMTASKQKIKVKFKTPSDGKFKFILFWDAEFTLNAENKGAFAVSGKNDT